LPSKRALRLLLFADSQLASSMTMLATSLRIAAARDDIEVAAVVDAGRIGSSRLRFPRALATWGVRSAFNPHMALDPARAPLISSCASIARRRRVAVLLPDGRDVNDPSLVETVRGLRPDATVALMVGQIFGAPLLDACRLPINYHDGMLPDYRGIAATGWSLYEGAERSGFTFHRMIERVDRGPILLQGAVPVGPGADSRQVEHAKTRIAARELSGLFDALASSEDATEQTGSGTSFTHADLRAIRTIDEPEKLTADELQLRLRCFGRIELALAGSSWSTTALRRIGSRPRSRRLAFRAADGVWLEPHRLRHLPPVVYRSLSAGADRTTRTPPWLSQAFIRARSGG
jgi:folate-dependent phosphoribosylglycinamide formyltransferase PurN